MHSSEALVSGILRVLWAFFALHCSGFGMWIWLGLEFRADCRGVGLGCGLALLWLGRRLEGFRLGAFNTTVGVGARTGAQPSESVLESFHH